VSQLVVLPVQLLCIW